jgi:hypothetical protein
MRPVKKEPREIEQVLDDITPIVGDRDCPELEDLLGELYVCGYVRGYRKAEDDAEKDRIVSECAAFEDRHIHPEDRDA